MKVNLFKYFIYVFIFRQWRRVEEGQGEKRRSVVSSICTLTGPGMGLDQESNLQPFTLRDDAQPTELHWSGRR